MKSVDSLVFINDNFYTAALRNSGSFSFRAGSAESFWSERNYSAAFRSWMLITMSRRVTLRTAG
jgi:hypothetical protein